MAGRNGSPIAPGTTRTSTAPTSGVPGTRFGASKGSCSDGNRRRRHDGDEAGAAKAETFGRVLRLKFLRCPNEAARDGADDLVLSYTHFPAPVSLTCNWSGAEVTGDAST